MILDNPDIKIVEARYDNVPFFFGVGKSVQREKKVAGEVDVSKLGGKGEYQTQKNLEWQIYMNPGALPKGFMPEEKLRDWMAGTVSAVSGSMDVYNPSTKYEPRESAMSEEAIPEKRPTSKTFPDEFLRKVFGDVDRKSIETLLERDKKVRTILEEYYRIYEERKHKH